VLELDDNVLLKGYVERGSEEAFAKLVARHLMYGNGKLWVDTNSFKWEIVGNLPPAEQLEFFFSNSIPYHNYRWRVEATRIMPNRCCMQVAEVWLTTSAPPNQAGSPAAVGVNP
jgi:hypothetical protein